jgi:hypothetical protein
MNERERSYRADLEKYKADVEAMAKVQADSKVLA